MKKKKPSKQGQVTTEYLLLSVVLVVLFNLMRTTLKDSKALQTFQERPTKIFNNLIENGNWEEDKSKSQKHHPNQHNLHYTPEKN